MTGPARILMIAICVLFIVYIITLVTKGKLLLKYSLLWLALSFFVCVFSMFPEPIYALSKLLGFELASNFIFIAAVFFILVIDLYLSVIASKQAAYTKTLIQEVALLKKEQSEFESSCDNSPTHEER